MNAKDIHIRGVGAVSAAGWSAADLLRAVRAGTPLPATTARVRAMSAPGPARVRTRAPPRRKSRCAIHASAALSAITRYSVAAALEALADAGHDPAAPPPRLGILFVMMNGCVNYTGRFYHEVLQNPAQASPLIFPETVFNAPASHIASLLGIDGAVSTLVGSPNSIMEALDTAAFWISSGIVEECLLIAAEECDWLSAEALTYYHPHLIASEGAGALLLSASGGGPRVCDVIGPLAYLSWQERCALLPELAAQTQAKLHEPATLIDDRTGISKLDRAESTAWSGSPWQAVLSPKLVLGESMGASAALQLVLGTLTARETQQPVVISMPGVNTAVYACVLTP
jgi:3-oxoacyl-[acyl-carrier-protein] synthase II